MKNSCLGIFLVFLFIIFFSTTIFLFTEKLTLLNTNFYKKQLEKVDFYNQGAEIFIDMFEMQSGDLGATDLTAQGAMEAAIRKTITADFLKEEVGKALTAASSFVNLKTDFPNVVFDLETARSDFEENLYQEVIKEQSISREDYKSLVYSEIEAEVNQIFKKYRLEEFREKDPIGFSQSIDKAHSLLSLARMIQYLSLIIAVGLLILIIFLARQSTGDVLRWTGWGIGISGILLVLLGLAAVPLTSFVRNQIFMGFQNLEQGGNLTADLVNQILTSFAGVLLWVSAAVTLIGAGMIISSYVVKKPNINQLSTSGQGSGSGQTVGSDQTNQKRSVSSAIAAARKQ